VSASALGATLALKMPAPAQVPILGFDRGQTISNLSIVLDATVLRAWRDGSEYGLSDPKFPYYAMDLMIASFPSSANHVLARYTGGKLKKDALYQLKGRFFVDTSREGGRSYFHIDEAIRFQGPGTLRSYRKPRYLLAGEVIQALESRLVVRWLTRDPYRRDMIYEQNAVVHLEMALSVIEAEEYLDRLCYLEGRMDGFDHRDDWACDGIRLC
jgi:hypothetical protein